MYADESKCLYQQYIQNNTVVLFSYFKTYKFCTLSDLKQTYHTYESEILGRNAIIFEWREYKGSKPI